MPESKEIDSPTVNQKVRASYTDKQSWFWTVALRRRWVIATAAIVAFATTLLAGLNQPNQFQAQARIKITAAAAADAFASSVNPYFPPDTSLSDMVMRELRIGANKSQQAPKISTTVQNKGSNLATLLVTVTDPDRARAEKIAAGAASVIVERANKADLQLSKARLLKRQKKQVRAVAREQIRSIEKDIVYFQANAETIFDLAGADRLAQAEAASITRFNQGTLERHVFEIRQDVKQAEFDLGMQIKSLGEVKFLKLGKTEELRSGRRQTGVKAVTGGFLGLLLGFGFAALLEYRKEPELFGNSSIT